MIARTELLIKNKNGWSEETYLRKPASSRPLRRNPPRNFAADYMARHGLKSTGAIQSSLSALSAEDLVEQHPEEGKCAVVDPLLRQWLVEKAA